MEEKGKKRRAVKQRTISCYYMIRGLHHAPLLQKTFAHTRGWRKTALKVGEKKEKKEKKAVGVVWMVWMIWIQTRDVGVASIRRQREDEGTRRRRRYCRKKEKEIADARKTHVQRKAANCQDAVQLHKQGLELLRRRRVGEHLLNPVLLLKALNQVSGSPQRFPQAGDCLLNRHLFQGWRRQPSQCRHYILHLIVEQLTLLSVPLHPLVRPLDSHGKRVNCGEHLGRHF